MTMTTPGKNGPVISVSGVSRWFGNVVSVSDISFDVYPGITGLLGPNGAGKTTLLRMITGLAAASEGIVTVFGEPVRNNPDLYRRIGVMSEHEAVYDFLTGRNFVRFAATMRGVADPNQATADAIEQVGLTFAADRKMGGYSRGMKQRIRLAATIVHDPELLILDEPLNGADPRQRVHFQQLLKDLAKQGRTIVVSSHILEEVEALADRVLLIVNGKLAASGDYRAIRAALNERPYHVRVTCSDARSLASGLVRLPEVEAVNIDPDGALIAQARNVLALQMALPKLSLESGVRLFRVEPLDDSLESVFSYLVGD
ncbi:MAG: ABC transporter ATP-binding protein [Chloroflexi bacterium]|nr:ABC transporter ATP-binding protein [Chloroflexota bacterium]